MRATCDACVSCAVPRRYFAPPFVRSWHCGNHIEARAPYSAVQCCAQYYQYYLCTLYPVSMPYTGSTARLCALTPTSHRSLHSSSYRGSTSVYDTASLSICVLSTYTSQPPLSHLSTTRPPPPCTAPANLVSLRVTRTRSTPHAASPTNVPPKRAPYFTKTGSSRPTTKTAPAPRSTRPRAPSRAPCRRTCLRYRARRARATRPSSTAPAG